MIKNPKKVIVAGDWHGNTDYAVSAIHLAKENGAEVIVHTGDFGFKFGTSFKYGVSQALIETGLELYFVPGNHDDYPYLYELPVNDEGFGYFSHYSNLFYVPRGVRWTWWDKTVLGLGGAVSVDKQHRHPGTSWWPEEIISFKEANDAIEAGPADIMITHDAPDHVEIPGINAESDKFWPEDAINFSHQHQALLSSVVDAVKPVLLFHGHFHRRYEFVRKTTDAITTVIGLDCDGSQPQDNMVGLTEDAYYGYANTAILA